MHCRKKMNMGHSWFHVHVGRVSLTWRIKFDGWSDPGRKTLILNLHSFEWSKNALKPMGENGWTKRKKEKMSADHNSFYILFYMLGELSSGGVLILGVLWWNLRSIFHSSFHLNGEKNENMRLNTSFQKLDINTHYLDRTWMRCLSRSWKLEEKKCSKKKKKSGPTNINIEIACVTTLIKNWQIIEVYKEQNILHTLLLENNLTSEWYIIHFGWDCITQGCPWSFLQNTHPKEGHSL